MEQSQDERLKALRQQTEKYGKIFAEQVANGLQRGGYVAHSHRDYCGMGLEFRDGVFTYAEVHDGYFTEYASLQWSSRELFIAWLANQSDASLARFDNDSWYWGNQTIDRKRLEPIAYKGR